MAGVRGATCLDGNCHLQVHPPLLLSDEHVFHPSRGYHRLGSEVHRQAAAAGHNSDLRWVPRWVIGPLKRCWFYPFLLGYILFLLLLLISLFPVPSFCMTVCITVCITLCGCCVDGDIDFSKLAYYPAVLAFFIGIMCSLLGIGESVVISAVAFACLLSKLCAVQKIPVYEC